MKKVYIFREGTSMVAGEEHEMIAFAKNCRDAEGALGNLRDKVMYAFDIDGVRTNNWEDPDRFEPDYADRFLMRW